MASQSSSRTPILIIAVVVLMGGLGGLAWLLLGDDGGQQGSGDVVSHADVDLGPTGTELDPVERPEHTPVQSLAAADRPSQVESIARTTFGETGTIDGRAVDHDQPLAGVQITLYKGNPHVNAAWTTLRTKMDGISTVTDENGDFSLPHVPVGQPYVVMGMHDNFARSEAGGIRVDQGRASTGVLLRMTKGAVIGGTVTNKETQAPIAGARAELYHQIELALRPESRNRPYKVVFADDAGRYSFPYVNESSIRIAVSADGYETQSRGVNFSLEGRARDRENVDFKLGVGKTLAGRVIDEAGIGIVDCAVTATALTKSFQGESVAFSDRGGYFLIEGLGDHSYNLRAVAEGYTTVTKPKVSPLQESVDITMQRQGAVAGTVTDFDGRPIPAFSLHLMRVMPGRAPGYLSVVQEFDSLDGRFLFDQLDPASYLLEARARGWANSRSEEFMVRRAELEPPEILIKMGKGGTVRGTVTDGDGKAVENATIVVRDNGYVDNAITKIFGQIAPRGNSEPSGRTDRNGSFSIPFVPAGTYQVSVSHPRWAPKLVNDVAIVDDSQGYNGPVDLMLPKGAVIGGHALDESSQPVPFTRVQVSMPGTGYMDTTTTDGNGIFRFDNLEEGTYKLTLSPDRDISGKQLNPIMMLVYSQKSAQEVHVRAGQVLDDMTLFLSRP